MLKMFFTESNLQGKQFLNVFFIMQQLFFFYHSNLSICFPVLYKSMWNTGSLMRGCVHKMVHKASHSLLQLTGIWAQESIFHIEACLNISSRKYIFLNCSLVTFISSYLTLGGPLEIQSFTVVAIIIVTLSSHSLCPMTIYPSCPDTGTRPFSSITTTILVPGHT